MCLYLYFLDIDNFNPGNILHLKNNNECDPIYTAIWLHE